MQSNKLRNSQCIEVKDYEVRDNKLIVPLHISKGIKKYFKTDTFQAEYDQNISSIDKSILNIPVISSIITAAWATGANVYIARLDRTFLDCLEKLKSVFQRWYPRFSCSTAISVEEIAPNHFGSEGYGLLFSGGLDSLTSYIRHKNKHPELFTVWGADIPLHRNKFWERVSNKLKSFSAQEGVHIHFIKTNVRSFLNERLLARAYRVPGWWGPVAHGLILVGLVAPLSTKNGTILISATHTGEFRKAWGSHPLIDNNISWADVKVFHDGYQLSRQDKIEQVLKSHPAYWPYLRVCYSQHQVPNCGHCEKCLRTITGLILANIDPRECNFDVNDRVFSSVRHNLIKANMYLGEDELFMWKDIQKRISDAVDDSLHIYGSKGFFEWFRKFDFSRYKMNKLRCFERRVLYFMKYVRDDPRVLTDLLN